GASARRAWIDEGEHVEAQKAAQRRRQEQWCDATDAALERAREFGLVPDPAILHRLLAERTHWEQSHAQKTAWHAAHVQLQRECELQEDELRVQLADRGIVPGDNLMANVDEYVRACRAQAKRRADESRLERRVQEEAVVARVKAAHLAAAAMVQSV